MTDYKITRYKIIVNHRFKLFLVSCIKFIGKVECFSSYKVSYHAIMAINILSYIKPS
jgi:hypothetical protein